ncbi:hypothetical protein AB0I60_00120 [Actinosynnema sp. NPDC050436]|uniref:alpha/beta fold hydrolase n=1 Tax=Actinosynnema sp. NPDC050436 TaxID=3155659 RepID=UPI0033E720B1
MRTLIVTGDSDLYLPPPVVRMVTAHLPEVDTLVYRQVGHCANGSAPRGSTATCSRSGPVPASAHTRATGPGRVCAPWKKNR